MSTATSAPAAPPQVVYVAPSQVSPGGSATPAAPTQEAPAPAATPTTATAPKAAEGSTQAKKGANMLGRIMGLIPLAAGVAQVLVGFMITRGTLGIGAVPLIGKLPPLIAGGLVSSTAVTSIMAGLGKILGKT